MLFNSIDFAIFVPIVFVLYWFMAGKSPKYQNVVVVVASYVFYGWWDWRFLFLIFFSTLVDYLVGLALGREADTGNRKVWLWLSVGINLSMLGFFKYYGFFVENFVAAFSLLGREIKPDLLKVILPVGISFYTFQTMSYTIDVYRKKINPTRDFIAFSAFVSFFPQLVAGPIERASHLLPQFHHKRTFEYAKAVDGLRQILWGLFKKIVIADNCATYANLIFNHSDQFSGSTLVLGALFFAFQIYGDFSGYSDIAIGTARLFGFDLMQNFAFPYFSRNVAEFWRRWHISLSTWFRDYLYIPLGGSRGSLWGTLRNTFLVFIISGFWHGARWTFIIWGALNACYLLPELLARQRRKSLDIVAKGRLIPTFPELLSMTGTFILIAFGWIFFRAENMGHAFSYIARMLSPSLLKKPEVGTSGMALITLFLISAFMAVEWLGREKKYAIETLGANWKKPLRYLAYYAILLLIVKFGGQEQQFLYFQF